MCPNKFSGAKTEKIQTQYQKPHKLKLNKFSLLLTEFVWANI